MAGEPATYSDADLDEILADKDRRMAALEAALRQIADMQTDDEPVAYSWGLEYFNRAHKIAKAALGDN